jgi:phage repressor protein C with HTH and peptisase S24 domain
MEPTLPEGAIVWVNHWAYLFRKPLVGEIILFIYNNKNLIKRIKSSSGENYEVVGDNSADSLQLGLISREKIKGRVLVTR